MKQRVQPRTLFISLSLLCLLAIWLSLALGPVSLPMFDTLRAGLRLLGLPVSEDGLQQAEMILGQIRLPRTLLGLAVGAVLALSGVAMQGLFRNPLADPFLLGSASGAALGVALALTLFGSSAFATAWVVRLGLTGAAFAGAVLGVLLTLVLARGVQQTLRLLLTGALPDPRRRLPVSLSQAMRAPSFMPATRPFQVRLANVRSTNS